MLLAGCGESRAPVGDVPAGRKVYRHSMDEAPSSLDPVQASNVYANHVAINVYDTLYSYKYLARPYELKPNLADGWPEISEDLLTYTIRLKQGVHFVDDPAFEDGVGREVTADDVVYSIKRHFDPAMRGQGAWLWQGRVAGLDEWKAAGADYGQPASGLVALDRYTLRIQLTKPYPQLLDSLAQGYASIVPREAVERYGKEFAMRPVGSGPFRLVSFDTSRIVLERNPKFRQEPVDLEAEGYDPDTQGGYGLERIAGRSPPFVDLLQMDFINEPSARWNSFTKGNEVQYTTVPNEQLDRVLASRSPVRLKPEYAERYHSFAAIEAGFPRPNDPSIYKVNGVFEPLTTGRGGELNAVSAHVAGGAMGAMANLPEPEVVGKACTLRPGDPGANASFLRFLAQELVDRVKQSVTIDWQVRENARAQIRVLVKRILRKYGYPPDMQQRATELVLQQAEVLCKDWTA